MKATGIVRKIDDLGRIVIPKEIRINLDLDIGTPIEIFTDSNKIILRKYAPGCSECGDTAANLLGVAKICKSCAEKLLEEVTQHIEGLRT